MYRVLLQIALYQIFSQKIAKFLNNIQLRTYIREQIGFFLPCLSGKLCAARERGEKRDARRVQESVGQTGSRRLVGL